MRDTAFLRSDELPGGTALGYLAADGLRTNVLHLPVRGSGDGGIYTTAADVRAFWEALFAGRIVAREWVAEMTRPRSDSPEDGRRYGLGFWLHGTTDTVMLEGYDAGVSFRSLHDPVAGVTATVISNWSNGAWPLVPLLEESPRPHVTTFRLDRLDHVSLNVSDRPASIAWYRDVLGLEQRNEPRQDDWPVFMGEFGRCIALFQAEVVSPARATGVDRPAPRRLHAREGRSRASAGAPGGAWSRVPVRGSRQRALRVRG